MGRSAREQIRECMQVDPIPLFERELADLVLLDVVITAEAD